jgi:molecular chaperone Hsp33
MSHQTSARILRALTTDQQIRFAALDASPLWDGVRRGHPQLEAPACAVLVELLAATLLLQSRTFFSERLQLLLKTSGRAKSVMADAWPDGGIRGMLDPTPEASGSNPEAAGSAPQAARPWLEAPGLLQVMRSNPAGQPYIGKLEMVAGPLQAQVEAYLLQSEQVQASMTLWCDPATGESGGLLVEPMPGCPPERMVTLVAALEGLEVVPLWERSPAFLASWINQGEGAEILADVEAQYRCRCDRAALVATLAGFGRERIEELFRAGSPMEVRCDYCGKVYAIHAGELLGGGPA